jgi:hypothetical protein
MTVVEASRDAYAALRENYDDPFWWRARLAQFVIGPAHRVYPGFDEAISVMDEEWDTLVVFDACRADLFEEVADSADFDSYRRVTSAGSMTAEWTERNFSGGAFGDTVYVSANPFTTKLAGDAFHEIYSVWQDSFDEKQKTVLPGSVADAAREAHAAHPEKRLIVHFMQPHHPFITDERFAAFSEWDIRAITGNDQPARPHSPFEALGMGLVEREELWTAYGDNLRAVLSPALDLAADLGGRTVLTSDHGNLLGERGWPVPVRLYSHLPGVRLPGLVRVPWAVIDGERRRVTDNGVRSTADADASEIKQRLRALGYHD